MSLHRIAAFLAVGLVALVGSEARGGDPPGRIGFRRYSTEAGIENPGMSWILQDGEGFVWALASDAVYRFDGKRFERFGQEAGLPSVVVNDVTLDAWGRLLLATQAGVVRWDGSRFVPVPMNGVPSEVWSLRLDSEKRMLAGTAQGLFMESEPGHFLLAPGWPGGVARALWVDVSGELQVASGSRLLSREPQGPWRSLEVHGYRNPIASLVRDGHGRLWLSGEGWLVVQPRSGAPFEDRTRLVEGFQAAGRRLRVGRRGQLLVPTYRGLIEVDGERAGLLRLGLPEPASRMPGTCWRTRRGRSGSPAWACTARWGAAIGPSMTPPPGSPRASSGG